MAHTATPNRIVSRDDSTGVQGYKKVKQVFRNTTQKVVTVQVARVGAATTTNVRKGAQGRTERRSRTSGGKAGSDEGGDGLAEPPPAGAVGVWTVECTPGHPFWVQGTGWVYAGALQAGDLLKGSKGESLRVNRVSVETRRAKTYNFEVAEWHTYFADGVWVHNDSTGIPDKLYHYTTAKAHPLIMEGGIKPSGPSAAHGSGIYLTDIAPDRIVPGTKKTLGKEAFDALSGQGKMTHGQLKNRLKPGRGVTNPHAFTHDVEVDVSKMKHKVKVDADGHYRIPWKKKMPVVPGSGGKVCP